MSQWEYLYDETEGIHKDKAWLTNGHERALFKPDTENSESAAELETSRIAKALGIPCAEIEIIEYKGRKGCVSYDVKKHGEPGTTYAYPDSLNAVRCRIAYGSKAPNHPQFYMTEEVTLETVKSEMAHILPKVVEMLFLDCLVRNDDRHGRNWELMIDRTGRILGMAPLYDHGLALWNDGTATDTCRMPYFDDVMLTHYAMFEQLATEYPEQIAGLMEKCAGIELCDYAADRFSIMREIHERVSGKERSPRQAPPSPGEPKPQNEGAAQLPRKPNKSRGPEL